MTIYHTGTMIRRQPNPLRSLAAVTVAAMVTFIVANGGTQAKTASDGAVPVLLTAVEGQQVRIAATGPANTALIRTPPGGDRGTVLAVSPFGRSIVDRPGAGQWEYALISATASPGDLVRRVGEGEALAKSAVGFRTGPVVRFLGGTVTLGLFQFEEEGREPVQVAVPVGSALCGVAFEPGASGRVIAELSCNLRLTRVSLEPTTAGHREVHISANGRDAAGESSAVLGLDGKPLRVRLPGLAGGPMRFIAELGNGLRVEEGQTVPVELTRRVIGAARE